ncbi:MAG TPA: HD domain-containing protein [Firmicutes bacterium]|nr:HD domain-containing protein [Bacillota bacterium]
MKSDVIARTTTGEEETGVRNFRLVGSAFVFAACYIFLCLVIFLMIVINDPNGWIGFFRDNYTGLLTLAVCTLLLFFIIYYYYYFEDREFLAKAGNVLLIFSLVTLCVILNYVFGKFVNIYARPCALFALLCVFLFNRRQAIMLNFIFSILMFVIDTYTNNFSADGATMQVYYMLMLSFVCGTFAIFAAGGNKTRGRLLLTGCVVAVPTVVIVTLLQVTYLYSDWIAFVASVGYSILGCVVSAILALAGLPVFETAFNRLTVFRLRELTSTNAPLLVRLKQEAPGTFNHSLVVAQLAESCAVAIGENAELARAAAYYHDVGKLKQPDCFTENQTGYNVHDELMPELSADIIRSHARDGYELLTAAHFPKIIADVAREHHGTLPIKYFYDKAMKLSGGEADIKDYSYLGPAPRSRIAAIVMIADASEAATRALPDRSPEKVERTVRSIIEERMDLDQFADCDITIRDLSVIRKTLVETLSGVHHHRVEYPAIRFNRDRQAVKEEPKE